MKQHQALVVTSFGSTYIHTRKACIEAIESRISEAFPDWAVKRAFTSHHVIAKMARHENIVVPTLEQCLSQLKQEGYQRVLVQPTHLTAGEEFDYKIKAEIRHHYEQNSFADLRLGRPILYWDRQPDRVNDYCRLVEALATQVPPLEEAEFIVWLGHGSPHRHNPAYCRLQEVFNQQHKPWLVGVVEETDRPNFDQVLAELKRRGAKQVQLRPLLVVAGVHARSDMAGPEESSWLNRLQTAGLSVQVSLKGLGENQAFQEIYVEHIEDALKNSLTLL